jgi:hypothetical protein
MMGRMRAANHISVTCTPPPHPPPVAICSVVTSLGGQLITNNKRWNYWVCIVITGWNESNMAAWRTSGRHEAELSGCLTVLSPWAVDCTPLTATVFVTLATQKHLEHPCNALFETSCIMYQWKSQWTVTIPGRTRCALLHYGISKRCTCPLNKRIWAFKAVKLFLKHPVYNES